MTSRNSNSLGVVRRSWLLVPLSEDKLVGEAWSTGADVIALDLMELVAEQHKPLARERSREAIETVSRGGAEVFVQVDKRDFQADLNACVWPGLVGIIVPRLESAQEVSEADDLLSTLEKERGLPPQTVQIVASIETAKGNLGAIEVVRSSPRIWGMTLGRADLVMDLRPEPSGDFHLMTYFMQRAIIIANATGLVPLGAWWRAPARGLLAGPDDTYEAALRGRQIGFKGSLCIRSDQVEPLNRGFTPSPDEVTQGQRLVDTFSQGDDSRAAIAHRDGRIIDRSAAEGAKQLIAYAKVCGTRDEEKAKAFAQTS